MKKKHTQKIPSKAKNHNLKPKKRAEKAAITCGNLVPVERQPRANRELSRVNEAEIRAHEQAELRYLEATYRNTTPLDREIFRKICYGIKKRASDPDGTIEEAHGYALAELSRFEHIRKQLVRNFLIWLDRRESDNATITLPGMATIMVLVIVARMRLSKNCSKAPTSAIESESVYELKKSV